MTRYCGPKEWADPGAGAIVYTLDDDTQEKINILSENIDDLCGVVEELTDCLKLFLQTVDIKQKMNSNEIT